MKHTPTPWKLRLHGNEQYPFPLSVFKNDGTEWVARGGTTSSIANAEFIVKACNSHDELLEALKDVASILNVAGAEQVSVNKEHALGFIMKAIKKAKGDR